jgi:hypothetical protein
MSTEEREVEAMFLHYDGRCEILWGDPKPPPPKPTRAAELRAALEHLKQAVAALRRAIKTA